VRLVRGGREILGLAGESGDGVGRHADQHLRAFRGDEITDDARQTRRAVVLACETTATPIAKSSPRLAKIALPAAGHRREIQEIRLAEAQQQSSDGQHGDRQHQCGPTCCTPENIAFMEPP